MSPCPRPVLAAVMILTLGFSALAHAADPACALRWRRLQQGVDYAAVSVHCGGRIEALETIHIQDTRLHLVRVTPGRVHLRVFIASALDRKNRTAKQWAREHRLAVATNLGMYLDDESTHVGYLRSGGHINARRWVRSYQSILVIKPGAAAMLDRDTPAGQGLEGYDTVVQNLRLIRRGPGGRGQGVWSRQTRRWSEAAVATDKGGRLLFTFNRAPLSMWELNRLLLSLPLGIVRAMHMEGGPEASLSIHAGGLHLDLCGSFETDFLPADSNLVQWRLPNVLGVARP